LHGLSLLTNSLPAVERIEEEEEEKGEKKKLRKKKVRTKNVFHFYLFY
jgi:hypothetical protein